MSVAKSYARSLYEAAIDQKLDATFFSETEAQMDRLLALLDQSTELKVALLAPITTLSEKSGIAREIAAKFKFSPLFQKFIDLLIHKKRLSILKEIRHHFSTVRLEREGGASGYLVSAEPLEERDIAILAKAFSQKLGKKVAFQVSTDPLLLAGVKVTLNGVTYDGTLRSQLQKLRDCFVAG